MTKSDNYIPTHFLYFSLLFFLLIFMYQQPYCLTLPKPFSQIFLFRIYASTNPHPNHAIDSALDETSGSSLHASPRQSSIHKPIHQRHTRREFHATTNSAPIQPPQTPHDHTAPQTHATQAPPTDVDAVDVDAQPASSGLTVRPSGRMQTQPPASPQFDRPGTGSGHTKTDSIRPQPQLDRPGTKQAAYRIRLNQIRQTRLN